MRTTTAVLSSVLCALLLVAGHATSQADERPVPGSQQANIHNPYSPDYLPLLPNSFANRPQRPPSGSSQPGGGQGGRPGGVIIVGGYYPWYPWDAYYPGPYYWPYDGPYYWPPAIVSADSLYGPAPVQRMLGGGDVPAARAPSSRAPRVAEELKPRAAGGEARERALRYLAFGDAQFAKLKYREALDRYRTAATLAPDLADAHFRQGHALMALANYTSAAKSFRRGLALRADWSESTVRLTRLYGGNNEEKTAHLEALAAAIDANPDDAKLLMLMGMALYFDGQAERARPFFRRCAQLGGNDDGLLAAFLRVPIREL